MRPPWSDPPRLLVGRASALSGARLLAQRGPVSLVGPAGVGSTTMGVALIRIALAEGLAHRAAFVRVHAATRSADILWEIGRQLGLRLPGDRRTVVEALEEARVAILLDDADLAPEPVREVSRLCSRPLWVATGRTATLGNRLDLQPLSDSAMAHLLPEGADPVPCRGRPLLARLPHPPSLDSPWRAVEQLPAGAELLIGLPQGLREGHWSIPSAYLRPVAGRVVARRAIAEAMDCAGVPSADLLAAAGREEMPHLAALATGALSGDVDDLSLSRCIAEQVEDADLAVLAAAAAARVALSGFQESEASRIIDLARREHSRVSPGPAGLLAWVEGDARLAQGDEPGAGRSHRRGAAALQRSSQIALLATMARHCAAAWSSRGATGPARDWLGTARECLAQQPDPLGTADVFRVAAELSVQAGEFLGAATLYEHAESALGPCRPDADQVLAAVRTGQTALEIARGELATAGRHLDQARELAAAGSTHISQVAAIHLRAAQLALHRGRLEEAEQQCLAADRGYSAAGSASGLVHAAVLRGDAHALRGDRSGAARAYREATALNVRGRDLRGARRTIRRWLAVEAEGLPGAHVEELRQSLDMAEVLLQLER